jgi:LPXTG-site transpeptidase (sortase) family protein
MESPLIGEGSVFRNLDQVPDKLTNGEEVQIITDNGTEQFLYRVTATRVVHEDQITLDGDGGPNIHLVSCFPRLVYDHRLIVDATLIAKKTSS